MIRRPVLAILVLAILVLAALGGTLAMLAPPRSDLAEFLPASGRTRASEFLFRELRSGSATTLLLAAIEGAPEAELARLSRETAAGLRASGAFDLVGDGSAGLSEAEMALLFRHRYLLSAATRPEGFTAEALRPRLEALLEGLRGAASPLLRRFGFADPTGAFLDLAGAWLAEARVEARDGAWFAADHAAPRVLLLARGRGAGLDEAAQRRAMAAFRAAFDAARPGPARLLLSGPGVFAAEAAATIQADVERIVLLATLLLCTFLAWRFRSVALLALVAVPMAAGVIAGYAATVAIFGAVHAIALGFGMTMLGVAVDYPILLLTLRREGEGLGEAARRIWPTLRLAAAAAGTGLAAMLGSGFPGLVQLGVFGGVGLLAAAATTRWVLPWLAPEARIAARPLPRRLAAALGALCGRPRAALAALGLAAAVLLAQGGVAWQRDLAALSPVPAAQQALDGELRRQLGAPDVRSLFVLGPGTEAEVLEASERLGLAAQPWIAEGILSGLDLPSRYLPSPATQRARQAALPGPEALRAALEEAARGMPFRPAAFAPFLDAAAESRALPPLRAEDLAASAPNLAARLSPLLPRREGQVWGVALAAGVADPAALAAAASGLGDRRILFLDIKTETEGVLAEYGRATLGWALAGGGLILGLLALGLGGVRAGLLAAGPILGAVLATLAVLALLGEALTLFHLAALLLLAGLGIDYSLFLGQSAGGDSVDTTFDDRMGAVLTCALSTLLTFGLLALCETPVLHGIGLTVAVGVAAAFGLACALSPRPARAAGG